MRNVVSGMLSVAVVFGASSALAQEFGSKGTPAISADRLAGFSIDHWKQTNPAPGKWVLEQRGLIESGFVRPPLISPTPGGLAKIGEYLKAGEQYLSPVDGFTVKGH